MLFSNREVEVVAVTDMPVSLPAPSVPSRTDCVASGRCTWVNICCRVSTSLTERSSSLAAITAR